jgi:putative membrane protein
MSVPAFAQQTPGAQAPTQFPACGYMWGGGWGWHPGIVLAPFVMLLALIGVVALIVWLVRCMSCGAFHRHGMYHGRGGPCPYCGSGGGRAALDVLEERFARGEIDKVEFEEKRKLLGR